MSSLLPCLVVKKAVLFGPIGRPLRPLQLDPGHPIRRRMRTMKKREDKRDEKKEEEKANLIAHAKKLSRTFSAPSISRDMKKVHKKRRTGSASHGKSHLSSTVNATSISSKLLSTFTSSSSSSLTSCSLSAPTKDSLMLSTPDWKRKLAETRKRMSMFERAERRRIEEDNEDLEQERARLIEQQKRTSDAYDFEREVEKARGRLRQHAMKLAREKDEEYARPFQSEKKKMKEEKLRKEQLRREIYAYNRLLRHLEHFQNAHSGGTDQAEGNGSV
eukprot:TRINITY_DN1112_c0_g1_i2.p1 TRINITY_DN1112_c0_g1~~TRINITY_DN1112_c0_g1_i2.p1  ORF type:complete len:274 (+),score=92.89 TRINITY_DN1112_c0_g1_i2:57-878(+)